jgi:D-glycero-D-manno-heptose 1,7-bisphosphate phosphatase
MHSFDTLFLDRDGVINVKLDERYVKNPSEFEFIPGAEKAISLLSTIFKRILILTNQQGIGKGIMIENELDSLHNYMVNELMKSEGRIDRIYFCPHLASEGCGCRKPNPGMIQQAKLDFPEINFENSYLVGDSLSDIEAGESMNLQTVRVDNEYTLLKWTAELMSIIE